MGRTGVSNMWSYDAFNNNPANVGRQKPTFKARFYFNLGTSLGYSFYGDYFSNSFYTQYFVENKGRVLNDWEKWDIVNKASDKGTHFVLTWNLLTFIYNTPKSGTFGISIDDRFWGYLFTPRDFMELIFFGNDKNRTYNLSALDYSGTWVKQINLTYSNKIKSPDKRRYGDIYYGFSIKPLFGTFHSAVENNNFSFFTDDTNRIFTYGKMNMVYGGVFGKRGEKFRYSFEPAGIGIAADIGFSMKVLNFMKLGTFDFGLSLIDAGYINWYKNSNKYLYDGGFILTDITKEGQIDSLEALLNSKRTSANVISYLPTTVRFGFNYRICLEEPNRKRDGKDRLELINFSVEYIQGLTNKGAGTTKPILAVGAEVNIGKKFSPRIGATFFGREKFTLSAGLGIDTGPVIIDIGTFNIQSIYQPTTSSKVSGGISVRFRAY